ncbi:translation initiation factor IF-2 subunit alpha [Thermofilum pendens]|uniref:Translation initiation factor 2 subunit alpha (AeIF-2a) n=1 Tax=Thermofilum pendens (strain DSM 2475 / Hrk 5) TaxID=368408 RepID=A1RXW4_THEPD|nr:translation initiation factor IF-2 subunit alpha [Thermofilum pendens]ABL78044.1 translation initiation factor 2 subunit alpha (aeIF-2a) [Thermofilum pendens Hrk 5]
MVRRREDVPSLNELVVGTVIDIQDHGAFVSLDEFGGLKAYIPLGEVSHSWFKNIRDVLKVGRKYVLKVIRVDRNKKLVDVSLRRVSEKERREKIIEWKRAQRAEKILEMAASKLNKTLDDAYREAGWKLEDHYGEIFRGLEEASARGEEALLEAGVSKQWAKVLAELARQGIKPKKVKLSALINLQCLSKGIEGVKSTLTEWENVVSIPRDASVRVYTLGSPRYKLDIEAQSYKEGEKILAEIISVMEQAAKKNGCSFSYKRLET